MTLERVQKIISKQLSVSIDKITETTRFNEDLNIDSLDIVEILMRLEDEFGISIPDEAVVSMKVVKDLVDYIDANKN